MFENEKINIPIITRCHKCGEKIERSKHLVKSKKIAFTCASCEEKYHREYSLRAYYQKKALRELVEQRRVTSICWGDKVGLVAAIA